MSVQRHEHAHHTTSVVKPLMLSSVSCTSLSDCVREWTDDTAGITRSSLTQESLPCDSRSHTWPSSLAASVSAPPLLCISSTSVHAPPPLPLSVAPGAVRCPVMTVPAVSIEVTEAVGQPASMDVFDLVLAQDVQQRRAHHRRRRRSARAQESEAAQSAAAAAPLDHCHPMSATVPALTCLLRRTAPHAHPPASSPDAPHDRCVSPELQHLSACAAVVPTALPCSDSTIHSRRGSRGDVSFSASPVPTREGALCHLRELLTETRTLHDALWQQLVELQRAEEKERRRATARRTW
ncbi:hypothetical protein NESM_000342900 [Novymonas esmeraldas]|uniref:Uncharacterized protein n=1 Tax=Novymonas esmeraldas TaxID=1808958 RepID=A0AAW0EM95_9TRYP